MKPELVDGAEAGCGAACQPSGSVQMGNVTMWFDHFIKCLKPTPEKPKLLVLDRYYAHI